MTEANPIADSKRSNLHRWLALTVVWLIALAAATIVDRPVAIWIRTSGIEQILHGKEWTQVVRLPGNYLGTVIVAAILLYVNNLNPSDSVFILFSGAMSGMNWLIKWLVGRTHPHRLTGPDTPYPFQLRPLADGIHGLIYQTNLSFPSGDMCLAAALATAVAVVKPKWAWLFFILAAVVGTERILENAHYVSDVFGAVGVGVGGTFFVRHLFRKFMEHRDLSPLARYSGRGQG